MLPLRKYCAKTIRSTRCYVHIIPPSSQAKCPHKKKRNLTFVLFRSNCMSGEYFADAAVAAGPISLRISHFAPINLQSKLVAGVRMRKLIRTSQSAINIIIIIIRDALRTNAERNIEICAYLRTSLRTPILALCALMQRTQHTKCTY